MKKIYVFGDSISEGIGSKKYSFCSSMQEQLNQYQVINCAKTGTTLRYMNEILDDYNFEKEDIVLIYYGSVDSIMRPDVYDRKKTGLLKIIPKRYFDNGMLDPRAFYSRKLSRYLMEKIESFYRYKAKIFLMKKYGTYQRMKLTDFTTLYNEILQRILPKTKNVFLVTLGYIDDKYFPGSQVQFKMYSDIIRKLAEENTCFTVELSDEIRKYDVEKIYSKDHFHPHYDGYQIIGRFFSDCISSNVKIDNEGVINR